MITLRRSLPLFAALALVVTSSCKTTPEADSSPKEDKESIPPEIDSGRRDLAKPSEASTFMVAAAHPLATAAGVEILKAGGSAVDAAIAVQAALTVVEPQSSGIGGGAFLLHHSSADKKLLGYDGRETAPASATESLFLDEAGKPLDFFSAVVGGRSVGAPGALRALELAHKAHGKLPWSQLFEPAIRICRDGFPLGARLHKQLSEDWIQDPKFRDMPGARGLYYDAKGEPFPVGHVIKNPELGGVLASIARVGADALYEGPIAESIVDAVKTSRSPGLLTLEDLKAYEAKVREPVCRPYRGKRVCGFAPPTSGGVTTLQILGLLERFDLKSMPPLSPEASHLIVEAERLAYADRGRYLADADFVDVPVAGLLDDGYLKSRSALIDPAKRTEFEPGTPPGATARADDRSPELPSTSHLVIVDKDRNVVSMTTSIEFVFGSRVITKGFLLNNQLTDFSFVAEEDGKKVANRVQAKKRPRSSMSPLIIYDGDAPRWALGSPGGSRIIPYVTRTAIALIDWGMDPQRAVSLPHVLSRGGPVELEDEALSPEVLSGLEAKLKGMGHEIKRGSQTSGLQVIAIEEGRLYGGADPRRDGVAKGE
jgi:gamma-glutamyltranspeptidase/glutathione hydrolase